MKKLTSYNYRKIINLVFLLSTIALLIIMTLIKNSNQGNYMLWEMMISSSTSNLRIGAIACGVLFVAIVFTCLLMIPKVLKKHNNSYFSAQGFITVILTIMLLFGSIYKVFSAFSIVLLVLTLIVNIVATIYSFLIAKFNYDEIYNYNGEDEKKEKEENDNENE